MVGFIAIALPSTDIDVTASWDKTARVWDAASGKEGVVLQPQRVAHRHHVMGQDRTDLECPFHIDVHERPRRLRN
jgi:hypothetical protein